MFKNQTSSLINLFHLLFLKGKQDDLALAKIIPFAVIIKVDDVVVAGFPVEIEDLTCIK